MFLKSMELMGFKSFADRTHIDFSSGISALLGPNGCGKSNIVDAVKWVLGEQSTKTMRAMKMEDVIFNGTVKRKKLNVAEVTLTISNENSLLELDAPEIEIKRRLYRSGESEYYINNTSVRLKELRELFFDTGIGKTAYSILEQGKIDQILSNKPEERRYLFEEAAGITKYKAKAQEAQRKLDRTRENIKQANNILTEVSKSYFNLKAQSEKTLEYRKLKDDLFHIEVNVHKLKLDKLRSLSKRRDEDNSKKRENLDKLTIEIKELSKELDEFNKENEELNSKLTESNKKLYGIDLESESFKEKLKSLKERAKEYKEQLDSSSEKEKKFLQRVSQLKKDIEAKEKEGKDLNSRVEVLKGNLESNIKESNKLNSNIEDLSKLNEESLKSIEDLERDRSGEVDKLTRISTIIADKLHRLLESYSSGEFDTLANIFKEKLKSALKNPSILYNLTEDFEELLSRIPDFSEILTDDNGLKGKEKIESNIRDILDTIEKLKSEIKERDSKIKDSGHKLDVVNEVISTIKVEIAETKIKITGIKDSSNIINKNLKEEESLLNETKKEKTLLNERYSQLVMDRDKTTKDIADLEKEKERVKKEIEAISKSIGSVNDKNSSKKRSLFKKKEDLSKITLQVERFKIESEHMESRVQELYDDFMDKYSLDLEDAASELVEFIEDEDQLKEKLANLKIKQKSLGQINLMAPEEFGEVSKRYNFLNDQITDLKTADENLSRVTKEIRDESTKLFFQTFESIQKSFSVMYQRLFGGGSAELELTDKENILESGIEIFARPPGKSLENIALLSGGERSLTAVALLFATYSIKPSPFCILDEIDAALDERNISRFVETLTEFSKESQFIVITHNKKTVTGSGTLLGVTMEESGVSKLITMRLDDEEDK